MPAQITPEQIARKLTRADLSSLPTANPGGGKPWISGGNIVVGANPTGPTHIHDDRYYTKSEVMSLINGAVGSVDLSSRVPYTGAIGNVNLGLFNLLANKVFVGGSAGPQLDNSGGTIRVRANNGLADAPFSAGTGTFSGNVVVGTAGTADRSVTIHGSLAASTVTLENLGVSGAYIGGSGVTKAALTFHGSSVYINTGTSGYGTTRLYIDTVGNSFFYGGINATGAITAQDRFFGSTGTGLFSVAGDNSGMYLTANNSSVQTRISSGASGCIQIASGNMYAWSNNATSTYSQAVSTNISQVSPGLLQIGTSAPNASGSLQLSNLTVGGNINTSTTSEIVSGAAAWPLLLKPTQSAVRIDTGANKVDLIPIGSNTLEMRVPASSSQNSAAPSGTYANLAIGNMTAHGTLSVTGTSTFGTNLTVSSGLLRAPNIECSGTYIYWASKASMKSPTDGELFLSNFAETSGVILDVTTDARLLIRNRADTADGNLQAGNLTSSGDITASSTSSRFRLGNAGTCSISTTAGNAMYFDTAFGGGGATYYFRENGQTYFQIAGGNAEIQGSRAYCFSASTANVVDIAIYRIDANTLELNN